MVEPHLQAHHQVAIQQAAQAHQHDGAVRRQITELVGTAGAGCNHPTAIIRAARTGSCRSVCRAASRLQLDLPARLGQLAANALCGSLGALHQIGLGFEAKGVQALFADVFFHRLQVGSNFGGIAGNTQRCAGDQKRQNQQKPPGAVDVVKAHHRKEFGPEWAKLVDVIAKRLALLKHRANDRSDADYRQQRDGKAHRRQQLHRAAQSARGDIQFNRLGQLAHQYRLEGFRNNKGRSLCNDPPC